MAAEALMINVGYGKTMLARQNVDGPSKWHNRRIFTQDAQKGDLLTDPTLARRDASCPKQGRSELSL